MVYKVRNHPRLVVSAYRATLIKQFAEAMVCKKAFYKEPLMPHLVKGNDIFVGHGREYEDVLFRCPCCNELRYISRSDKIEVYLRSDLSKLERLALYGMLAQFKIADKGMAK